MHLLLIATLALTTALVEDDPDDSDDPILVEDDESPGREPSTEPLDDTWTVGPSKQSQQGDIVFALPSPLAMGGLGVLPLPVYTDLDVIEQHLYVPATMSIVLVSGEETDRFSVDGVRLQLPPPFALVGLDSGVYVVGILRDGEVVEQKMRCATGRVTVLDANPILASKSVGDGGVAEHQRFLLATLYSNLEDSDDPFERVRICMRFIEENPGGEASAKARDLLIMLRERIEDEDSSSLDVSDNIATEDLAERDRLTAIASAPRPVGTRTRQVLGITLASSAVVSGVAAVALDRAAAQAAVQYHQQRVVGGDAVAAPYLDQTRGNDDGSRVAAAGAITAGVAAVTLLVVDRALHARWRRLREEMSLQGPEVAVVPTGLGVAIGGAW